MPITLEWENIYFGKYRPPMYLEVIVPKLWIIFDANMAEQEAQFNVKYCILLRSKMLKSVNNFEKWHRPTFYLMQTGFWIAGGAVHTAFSKGKGFIEFNLRKFPGKSKTSWENYFRCRAVKCLSFDLLYLFWYLCLVNANFLGKIFQCRRCQHMPSSNHSPPSKKIWDLKYVTCQHE